jgi:predicted dehydrogenase
MAVQCIHIGVGGRGKWPVQLFTERDDVESVAFVDIHEGNMNAAMEVSGMPESKCFRTLEQALNNVESDCVVVITPPDDHAGMILEAVRAGKHVLVEKPFTKTLASAKHVVAEADRMGVKVGASQNAKYNAATVTLSRHLREETYGKASFGLFTRIGWRSKGVHHSGLDDHSYLWERGIHDMDTMRFIFGKLPVRMWAHSFNPPWSPYKGGAGVSGWIEFDGGATATYFATFEPHKSGGETRVDVDEGTLSIEGGKLILTRRKADPEELPLDDVPNSTTVIVNKFVAWVNGGEEPEFSARNNLVTMAMIEGMGISSEAGRTVSLKEFVNV